MKHVFLTCLLGFSAPALAWDSDLGTISRVWVSGASGHQSNVCVELTRANGSTQMYGMPSTTDNENKNRVTSVLLAAQTSGKSVQLYFQPDQNSGPTCEIGDARVPTRALQSLSIIP